jgi:hypothetical protein
MIVDIRLVHCIPLRPASINAGRIKSFPYSSVCFLVTFGAGTIAPAGRVMDQMRNGIGRCSPSSEPRACPAQRLTPRLPDTHFCPPSRGTLVPVQSMVEKFEQR